MNKNRYDHEMTVYNEIFQHKEEFKDCAFEPLVTKQKELDEATMKTQLDAFDSQVLTTMLDLQKDYEQKAAEEKAKE